MINKSILLSGINVDDSFDFFQEGDYILLENGQIAVSDTGKDLRVENVKGTTAITNTKYPVTGVHQTLGSCVDIANRRLVWFAYNSLGEHGIYVYDFVAKAVYAVLYSSQVTGGLNFSKDYRVDRNCKVINGLLYWTDNLNETRCINIDSGIKLNQPSYVTDAIAYVSPIDPTSITLIKRPPAYPISFAKVTDGTFVNNYISSNSFKFWYRYSFYDSQISANSAMTDLVPYNYDQDTYNAIDITLPLAENIRPDVEIVQIVVQFGNTGSAYIIKEYNKNNAADAAAIAAHNAGTAITYRFYNDLTGIKLDAVAQVNSQDLVPLKTKTLEIAKDRLFLGSNLKGYNTPNETSLAVGYTDTTTINVPPVTTGTMDEIGFNTPTTVPLVLVGSPINTSTYGLQTQNYNTANPASGMYPTWSDSDMIFNNISASEITLVVNGKGRLWNSITVGEYRYTEISFYWYLSTSTTKTVTKVQTFDVDAGEILDIDFNFSLKVPASTKVWLVVNPDLGVTGENDNKFVVTSSNVYVVEGTTIVYPPPHFKRGGSYKFATAFYDRFRRKCGVVTNTSATLNIPTKGYDPTPANYATWALSNVGSTTQIPDWAYYYQILITKNLQQASFIQSVAQSIFYATKNLSTGVVTYTEDTYNSNSFAIGVNMGGITDLGVGYVYNEGDVVVLSNNDGLQYTLKVLGTNGNWLHCEKKDLGVLGASALWQFEIYTPYKDSMLESYYEATPVYDITNPTEANRVYSTLTGDIYGDSYYLIRSDSVNAYYQCETMNPNDKFWSIWDRSLGWANILDSIGQQLLKFNVSYSDTIIQGSKTNGLNKFQVLNYKTVDSSGGNIQKLQLSSKQEADGNVMLCICTDATFSLYLSETQLVASASNDALAVSNGVIGTINSLKGKYGTNRPETVIEYLGNIFWFDDKNGCVIQYNTNGLTPISSYKMSSLFSKYAKDLDLTSNATLDTLNGFHHVPTAINPLTGRFNITTPALIAESAAPIFPSYGGVIPSYAVSIIDRFDIKTNLAQTLCFDFKENRWKESFEFAGEWYDSFENTMFGFKNGVIYTHDTNSSTRNTFYGVQKPLRILYVDSRPLSGVKQAESIAIESNAVPDFSVCMSKYPNTQITDLTNNDYTNREGVFYANWFRDRLSPSISGTADEKMYKGDSIVGKNILIQLEFQQFNNLCYLSIVNSSDMLSRGQKKIILK